MWDDLPGQFSAHPNASPIDDARLRASYTRCEAAGIDRSKQRCEPGLRGKTLQTFLAHHNALSTYTHLLFAELHRHLADPTALLLVADPDCRIVELSSHPAVLRCAAAHHGMRPGVSMNETSCGTNAVALALHDYEGSVVRGRQHYCRMFDDWCTAAVPVWDIDSRVSACVAMATSVKRGVGEQLALAKCMAREVGAFFRSNSAQLPAHDAMPGASGRPIQRAPVALTNRQHEVLCLFARGLSYKQIAVRLGIHSVKTVEEHLDAVRSKLGATCRRECISKAGAAGLLDS